VTVKWVMDKCLRRHNTLHRRQAIDVLLA